MSLPVTNYFANVSVTIKGNFIVKGAIKDELEPTKTRWWNCFSFCFNCIK